MTLERVSADSIHLIGCGLNAISADSIHLIGCGLSAVSDDSLHLILVLFNGVLNIPLSRCHGRSIIIQILCVCHALKD